MDEEQMVNQLRELNAAYIKTLRYTLRIIKQRLENGGVKDALEEIQKQREDLDKYEENLMEQGTL